ncbi:MAG TPA: DUF2723 domain-containing protein [Elusimicrobiota bacterium]|nr:DUF2723 domain-containing protein [Elusimicrobiota bacterium]
MERKEWKETGVFRRFSASSVPSVSLFFGAFALYLFCAYPSIAPRDSADLASAALGLTVAHPPGYPLYAVLGRAWLEAFPLGNPAYRLNVLSALCGAGAVACFFIFLRRRTGQAASTAAALGASLAFGSGAFFWKFCLLEEMYAAQALLLTLLLLLCEGEEKSHLKRLSLSGLLFGLGLVNHQSLALFAPALFWLWREERRSLGGSALPDFGRFCAFCGLGLSLEFFLWIRLHDAGLAWDVLRRASYGTLTLFGPYSVALTPAAAGNLIAYLAKGLCKNGLPAVLLASVGVWMSWRADKKWFRGLALGFLFFGPLYFLATRFNLSQWTVRGVLAPDFIAPSLFLCAFCAYGLERLGRRAPFAVWPAALLLAAWPLAANAAAAIHRNDFSAYDYARDLRRDVPPGSAAVVGGDTALFGLHYLELASPDSSGRIFIDATEQNLAPEIADWMKNRPVYVAGLSEDRLAELGLMGNPFFLRPEGLCQEVERSPAAPARAISPARRNPFWVFSVQRFAPGGFRDPYVHDVRLSYGFAHYLSARLSQSLDPAAASAQYEAAFAADPGEYRIVLSSGKSL